MRLTKRNDEYLTSIIHDLQTPTIAQIQALQSLIRTLEKKISNDEADLLELTLNSCSYMRQLIETFSMVNKLDHERIKLIYEKFNLTELIDEIVFECKILFKYYNLKVEFNKKDETIVFADKNQIRTVVEHIISNAINQAFKDSTIIINIKKNKNDVSFEVKNSSLYIEPEVLKEIFEKKKVHNSSYSPAGVGLGFYLCREIINAHFGKMVAKSSVDNINVFGFVIPLR